MKKGFKWMVPLMLCGVVLSACGSGDSGKDEGASNKKITIMTPYVQSEPPGKDSEVIKNFEKITGEDVDINWVPNDSYDDKINVTLASGDLPDIMVFKAKNAGFVKSVNAGAFWDLTDHLKDYPNLAKANEDVTLNASVNGKVYGVYRTRDRVRSSVTIRKDWLEKLGLEEPKTTEDLYNVAKAFTEQDPDGNGKNDTTGILFPKWEGLNNHSPYDVFSVWYGAPNAWGKKDDGTIYPAFETDEYLESMKWTKDMIDKGYVNKDFATIADDVYDRFVQGKGGILVDMYSAQSHILKKAGDEKAAEIMTYTGTLEGPDGEKHTYPTDGYSGLLVIPKQSVKTEKDLKRVLTFLDKTQSREAQIAMNNGIEGKNFTADADGIFGTPKDPDNAENQKIQNDVSSLAQVGTNVAGSDYLLVLATDALKESRKEQLKLMAADEEYIVDNVAAPLVSTTYAAKGANLDTIIFDARVKYLSGQLDDKGWKDQIELWKKSGGSQVIEEMTKLSKELEK